MSASPTVRVTNVYRQYNAPRLDLEVAGRPGCLILPESRPRPTPWVWYAPTFAGRLPSDLHTWIATRLLAAGVAIAGVDVGESYGSPAGRQAFTTFRDALVPAYELAERPALLGQSRGALMHYNWAVEHPGQVQRIAGIYPVCNFAAWPGADRAAPAYEMTPEQLQASLAEHNPVARLPPSPPPACPSSTSMATPTRRFPSTSTPRNWRAATKHWEGRWSCSSSPAPGTRRSLPSFSAIDWLNS